jgi:hypothetical protein
MVQFHLKICGMESENIHERELMRHELTANILCNSDNVSRPLTPPNQLNNDLFRSKVHIS